MFDRFSEFFQNLKARLSSKQKKHSPFVILICVLIIIVPTFLAFFYAYFYDDSAFLSSSKVEVSLYDSENKLIASEKVTEADIEDSSLVRIFAGINSSKTPIELQELPDSPNFKVSIKQNDILSKYNCYFSESAGTSYVTDESGTVFAIPESNYNKFLNSEFSESVYSCSLPPILTTSNRESVVPLSGSWHYRQQNGNSRTSTSLTTVPDLKTYKMGGTIDFSFDREPNECSVEIYDSEQKIIYSGTIDKVSSQTVKVGAELNIKITAKWENTPNADFYGELSYDFMVIVTNRSEFSLSASSVYPGQFIIISGTNVDDPSKILFSSLSSDQSKENEAASSLSEFTPSFSKNGELVKALLPFPYGLSEDTFSFNISYGATEQLFSVSILNSPSPSESILPKTANNISSVLSEKSLKDFSSLIKGLSSSSQNTSLFPNKFASPEEFMLKSGYSYSDNVISEDALASFVANGNEYITESAGGASVPALSIGIVIKTGHSSYLGDYVVVEHGLGIRTWYCWLSSIDVDTGDILALGDTVGKCGSEGLLSSRGVLVLCSVYQTLIDPSFVLGKEIEY